MRVVLFMLTGCLLFFNCKIHENITYENDDEIFNRISRSYKQIVTFEDAKKCCYKECEIAKKKINCNSPEGELVCDCQESCSSGPFFSMIDYGWTPNREEFRDLFNKYNYKISDYRYKPLSSNCSKNPQLISL